MSKDPAAQKGAVAQDRPEQKTNTSLNGQNAHRDKSDMMQGQDSDFPEGGENEEHSMEKNVNDPGTPQKRNQNDRKEDPLAS